MRIENGLLPRLPASKSIGSFQFMLALISGVTDSLSRIVVRRYEPCILNRPIELARVDRRRFIEEMRGFVERKERPPKLSR